MDGDTIPQEAGINERAVSFTKGCYVGQETVARLHYKGKPNRHLRGLRLTAPADRGDEILLGEKVVGRLGSTCESPRLGPIALALVRREAAPGDEVLVAGAAATVVELPFHAWLSAATPRSRHGLSGASPLLGGPSPAGAALRPRRAATLDLPPRGAAPAEPRELRTLIPPAETGRGVDDWGARNASST